MLHIHNEVIRYQGQLDTQFFDDLTIYLKSVFLIGLYSIIFEEGLVNILLRQLRPNSFCRVHVL